MIKTLNSLRFILIFMIMIHCFLPTHSGLYEYLGECSVAIFFVISGFVLSLSKGEKLQKGELSNKQFFFSRIFKLYPLHLFIIAITLPMDWRLGHLGAWYQILAHALLLQCWVPTHQFVNILNASTWFISNLIFFYLIFKYLYRWIIQKSWLTVLSCMGAYMIAYIILDYQIDGDYSAGFIYFFPPFRLIDFCIGILCYKFYSMQIGQKLLYFIETKLSVWQAHLTDILLIIMFIGMYECSIHCNPNFRCAALYWTPSAITLLYIATIDKGKGWLTHLLHNKYLQWLGGISFEIYLCNGLGNRIIQSIFLRIYGEDIPYLGLQFFVSLALTLLMAWAAKRYIVTPTFERLKKKL